MTIDMYEFRPQGMEDLKFSCPECFVIERLYTQ